MVVGEATVEVVGVVEAVDVEEGEDVAEVVEG